MHHIYPVKQACRLCSPIRRLIHPPALLFSTYIREGDVVIDFGCGPGFFTLALAEMVGERGRVIAIDLQDEMLSILEKRARSAGLLSRISVQHCRGDTLSLCEREFASFALAFHVFHETEHADAMLQELYLAIKPKGCLYIAEPKLEVSNGEFSGTIRKAEGAGFRYLKAPFVLMSRTALLERV